MKKVELKIGDIQQVSLQILKTVADICEKNNFKYILAYGTLIGSIRHQGFIPWDDDIDIIMPRPDYESFLKFLYEHPQPNLKVFNQKTNAKYLYGITRICDIRYEITTFNETDCGMGLFIDVYPFDGLGDSKEEALNIQRKCREYVINCYNASRSFLYNPHLHNLFNLMGYYFNLLKCHIKGKGYYFKCLDDVIAHLDYNSSDYVGLVSWIFNPERNLYKKEWLEDTIWGKFEGFDFRIPKCYDEMLRSSYGDYMQLPPEEQRVYHHQYKAYKKE